MSKTFRHRKRFNSTSSLCGINDVKINLFLFSLVEVGNLGKPGVLVHASNTTLSRLSKQVSGFEVILGYKDCFQWVEGSSSCVSPLPHSLPVLFGIGWCSRGTVSGHGVVSDVPVSALISQNGFVKSLVARRWC